MNKDNTKLYQIRLIAHGIMREDLKKLSKNAQKTDYIPPSELGGARNRISSSGHGCATLRERRAPALTGCHAALAMTFLVRKVALAGVKPQQRWQK